MLGSVGGCVRRRRGQDATRRLRRRLNGGRGSDKAAKHPDYLEKHLAQKIQSRRSRQAGFWKMLQCYAYDLARCLQPPAGAAL